MGENEDLFVVERLLNKRFSKENKCWEYEVKWQGYSELDNTWEPEENLSYIPEIVKNFNLSFEKKLASEKKKKQKSLDNLAQKRKVNQELKNDIQSKASIEAKKAMRTLDKLDIDEDLPIKKQKIEEPSIANELPPQSKIPTNSNYIKPVISQNGLQPQTKLHSHKVSDPNSTIRVAHKEIAPKIKLSETQTPVTKETSPLEKQEIHKSSSIIQKTEVLASKPSATNHSISSSIVSKQNSTISPLNNSPSKEQAKHSLNLSFMDRLNKTKGDFRMDQPSKIIGCRQEKDGVYFAVCFKKRRDGSVPTPNVYHLDDMKIKAPYLLSEFVIEQVNSLIFK